MIGETRYRPTIREPSAWLRGAAARRVAQIGAQLKDIDASAYGMVVAPLGSSGPPGSLADRQCDRDGAWVPPSETLHVFAYRATPRIMLCGGLCASCARKEGVAS